MIRVPRLRLLATIALLALSPGFATSPVQKRVLSISPEAKLDLGAKLNQAIFDHRIERVRDLLERGASPDPVADLRSPLQMAISVGDSSVFRTLLDAGADSGLEVRDRILFPHYVYEFGYQYWDAIPLLFEAAIQPDPVFARTLLERGADPKASAQGIQAAFVAARFDNLAVFRMLVEAMGGMTAVEFGQVAAYASLHGGFTVLEELKLRGVPANPDSLCKGLAKAIKDSDTTQVRAFLDHGAPLDPRTPTYYTPLLRALDRPSKSVFELLLDRGAKVDVADPEGMTPLLLAAKKSDTTWLVRLLEKGADVQATNHDGQNALHLASPENIPVLLARKIKLDVVDKKGISPLLKACRNSSWSAAKAIVAAGADVRRISSSGETPLSVALAEDRYDLAELMMRHGGDLNAVPPKGTTILQATIASGRGGKGLRKLEWLLLHGADPSLPDASGRTPMELAVSRFDWPQVGCLVRFGARSPDIPVYVAKLAGVAVENEDDSLLAILVRQGCNLDLPDTNLHRKFDSDSRRLAYTKEPALIQAIRGYRTAGVERLLRHGASPNVSDRDGVPALLLAIRLQEIEVVKLFLEHNVDVTRRDAGKKGVREYLDRIAYPQMAELLSSGGGR